MSVDNLFVKVAEQLIGKTVPEARKKVTCLRITREDNVTYMGTYDVNMNRINIEVDNGVITSAKVG